jgi:cyclopropane-fatty-acyl-phospholipid synthase
MDKASTTLDAAMVPDSLTVRLVRRLLGDNLHQGTLLISLPNNVEIELNGQKTGRRAHLNVKRWRAVLRIICRGGVGFAEGYLNEDWDSDSLPELLIFVADNLQGVNRIANGLGIQRFIDIIGHARNRNSRSGSRRNISFHYDLGNDFYQQWLDRTMSYSAGIFENTNDLEASQHAKYERLCEIAEVSAEHNVLEIGCGWGGLLEHLTKIGCRATGISVSKEQVDYANQRLDEADEVSVRFQDYRNIEGQYDRVLSIEMFEAVGEAYWDTFASKLAATLSADGIAAMQIITIDEQAAIDYQRRPDFIQQYVFPGGMLPTVTQINDALRRQGLGITNLYRFGQDYGLTLKLWREQFEAAWPAIQSHTYDDRFYRLWMYYLCYCEAGFSIGRTDVIQIKIERLPDSSS